MNEWDAVCIRKALVEAEIEAMGMRAENEKRVDQGFSQAYGEEAFQEVLARMNAIFEAHRS